LSSLIQNLVSVARRRRCDHHGVVTVLIMPRAYFSSRPPIIYGLSIAQRHWTATLTITRRPTLWSRRTTPRVTPPTSSSQHGPCNTILGRAFKHTQAQGSNNNGDVDAHRPETSGFVAESMFNFVRKKAISSPTMSLQFDPTTSKKS